jgi:hypothetical protein
MAVVELAPIVVHWTLAQTGNQHTWQGLMAVAAGVLES